MDSGRHLIAENDPFYEEVLGVTGQFFKATDSKELTKLLKSTLKQSPLPLNTKAKRRAQTYFAWKKILPQYLALYNSPVLQRVAVDSVTKQSWQRVIS